MMRNAARCWISVFFYAIFTQIVSAEIVVVAETGQTAEAPELADGVTFNGLSSQTIGANGQIAFTATLIGPGITHQMNDMSVWAGRPDNLRLVARTGDQAPDTEPGTVFSDLYGKKIIVSASGAVAFWARLTGPSVTGKNSQGVFVDIGGELRLLARAGDPAPRVTGEILSEIGDFAYTDGGIVFHTTTQGSVEHGVWTGTDHSNLKLIAFLYDPVGGEFPDCDFGGFWSSAPPVINNAGTVILTTTMTGGQECNQSVLKWQNDRWSRVVVWGDKIPGFPETSDDRFSTFGSLQPPPRVNTVGETVYTKSLFIPLPESTGFDNTLLGIWLDRADGTPELIALTNETLPTGKTLAKFPSAIVNDSGTVVALATLKEGETALISGQPRSNFGISAIENIGSFPSTLIAQTESSMFIPPGLDSDDWRFDYFNGYTINEQGTVVFSARAVNNVSNAGNDGIWKYVNGKIDPIILDRRDTEVDCEVRQTQGLKNIFQSGNGDGLSSSISDNSEVVFGANMDTRTTAILLYTEKNDVSTSECPQVLFLDFSEANATYINPFDQFPFDLTYRKPAFEKPTFIIGTRESVINQITNKVKEIFSEYNVEVTKEKPAVGEFSTIWVGGSYTDVPSYELLINESGKQGIASKIDFGNEDKSDTAIVFSEDIFNVFSFTDTVAQVIAHEAGHIFGLLHIIDSRQLMYNFAKSSAITINGPSCISGAPEYSWLFGTTVYCARFPPNSSLRFQDSHKCLINNIGQNGNIPNEIQCHSNDVVEFILTLVTDQGSSISLHDIRVGVLLSGDISPFLIVFDELKNSDRLSFKIPSTLLNYIFIIASSNQNRSLNIFSLSPNYLVDQKNNHSNNFLPTLENIMTSTIDIDSREFKEKLIIPLVLKDEEDSTFSNHSQIELIIISDNNLFIFGDSFEK